MVETNKNTCFHLTWKLLQKLYLLLCLNFIFQELDISSSNRSAMVPTAKTHKKPLAKLRPD